MWTGFAGLALGWAALFLMVVRVIPPSFPVAFGAYALTVVGFVTGLIGTFSQRRRDE